MVSIRSSAPMGGRKGVQREELLGVLRDFKGIVCRHYCITRCSLSNSSLHLACYIILPAKVPDPAGREWGTSTH